MPNDVTIEELQIVISQESTDAVTGISNLTKVLQELKSCTTGGLKSLTTMSRQLERFNAALSAIPDLTRFEQLRDILAQIKGIGNIDISKIVKSSGDTGGGSISEMAEKALAVYNPYIAKLGELRQSLAFGTSGEWEKSCDEIKSQCEEVSTVFSKLGAKAESIFSRITSAFGSGTKSANKFFASVKRIALYRAIRTMLKYIVNAFKEGLQNFALYSDDMNQTLSELKTTALQLKNTLGVTFGTALQSAAPVIQMFTEGIIYAVNGLNMLMALLSGKSSYTKAIAYWQDYADSVDEAKKSIMGFDEINTLGNPSTDYSAMFEETDIDISDMLGGLTTLAGIITSITLLVSVLKGSSFSGFLGSLKTVGGVLLTIVGYLEEINAFIDIWENGSSFEDMNTALLAIGTTVAGLTLLFGQWGAVIGLVTGAIGLLTTNIKDMVTNGMTVENVTGVLTGLSLAITAVTLAMKGVSWQVSLIVLLIGGLIYLVGNLISNWDSLDTSTKAIIITLGALAVAAIAAAIAGFAMNSALTFGIGAAIAAAAIVAGIAVMMSAINSATASIGSYAEGGFPETGQLFIAREAGAEMVGSIGGHTAVANNDQIVEAIKQGVYEAMQSSESGGDWTIQLVDRNGRIRGTEVITAAQRKNQRDGKTTIQLGT